MNDNRIRFLVIATILGMLLTACGSGGGGGDDNDTAGGAAETRTVTDDFGTQVTVPVAPQRVVTTHFLLTMGTLDLGVAPVGTAVWAPANVTDRYAATLADVPVVASQTAEPELEKIAAQSPDLILATSFNDEQVIGRLREIAPTYVVDVSAGGANATSWSERTSQLADVLGRTAEAGTLASAFEQRKQQLIQTHANQINGTTAAVVTGFRDDNASVFAAESGIGQIVTSLGFTYSPQATVVAAGAQNGIANVSFERITTSVGDAEVLFLGSDLNGGLSPVVTALQQTQLYRDLPAVRANRVGVFKPQVTGYTDANFALDQIEQTLTGMQG